MTRTWNAPLRGVSLKGSEASGKSEALAPGLYVTATPIGHARDVSLRALDVLAGVDLIAAEDTRVTSKLLAIYGIAKPLTAYNDHNAPRERPRLLKKLAEGVRVALVSDAGTPLVSDPGFKLVREAVEAGIAVYSVPGASAPLAALAACGLPTDRFLFAGFLPPKQGERRRVLEELKSLRSTLVFFEAPQRLAESLADMAAVLGPRQAAVARELTKLHEEIRRGDLASLAGGYPEPPKGEIVIVIGPAEEAGPDWPRIELALGKALSFMPLSAAVDLVAEMLGAPRREVYARALAKKNLAMKKDDGGAPQTSREARPRGRNGGGMALAPQILSHPRPPRENPRRGDRPRCEKPHGRHVLHRGESAAQRYRGRGSDQPAAARAHPARGGIVSRRPAGAHAFRRGDGGAGQAAAPSDRRLPSGWAIAHDQPRTGRNTSMALTVAVQMDPIDRIDIGADSTFALLLEATARGHALLYYNPRELTFRDGKVTARARPLSVKAVKGDHFALGDPSVYDLSRTQVVLMRQDPPFDLAYITATHILEMLAATTLVVNDPASVRNAPEKLFVTLFEGLMPPTLITSDRAEIASFRAEHKDIILKPLYGNGGAGVFRVKQDDENLNSLLEMFTAFYREPVIVQRYLPQVRQGDKRIILVDGEFAGAVNRVPAAGEARSNMHVGGKPEATTLTPREKDICDALAPELKARGLLFAGIDVIGGYLTEINVTSPTGLQEVKRFGGPDGAKLIWDAIEKRLKA
jgi:glutathione synthase